jgi:hypothetical protein
VSLEKIKEAYNVKWGVKEATDEMDVADGYTG